MIPNCNGDTKTKFGALLTSNFYSILFITVVKSGWFYPWKPNLKISYYQHQQGHFMLVHCNLITPFHMLRFIPLIKELLQTKWWLINIPIYLTTNPSRNIIFMYVWFKHKNWNLKKHPICQITYYCHILC